MRCGEAKRIQWTEIDFEKSTVTLSNPEKSQNSRDYLAPVVLHELEILLAHFSALD